MDANIPQSVLDFGKRFSVFKTPAQRTDGAKETARQTRGEPDWIDTVATLMLWRELVTAGLPVTFHLTANTGDQTDLRVQDKGSAFHIDINVKGTKSVVPAGLHPETYGNVPLKHEELGVIERPWAKAAGQALTIEVQRDPADGRVYAAADEVRLLADIYIKVFVHAPPDPETDPWTQNHVHFCRWLASDSAPFQKVVNEFAASVVAGKPTTIRGIEHPGLWVPSGRCRPFADLVGHLDGQLRQHSPGWIGTGRSGAQLRADLVATLLVCEWPDLAHAVSMATPALVTARGSVTLTLDFGRNVSARKLATDQFVRLQRAVERAHPGRGVQITS